MSLYCNGQPATAGDLAAALPNYGHFTSLQVRGGAVQGLELHLQRLYEGTRELFDAALDLAQVQAWMQDALQAEGRADASLRVTVFARGFDFRQPLQSVSPDVLVAVGPPAGPPPDPRRLRSVRYQRDMPQLKHVGTFALFQQRRLAAQAGFDDALFVGTDGCISEGTTWNIGFARGGELVWPRAPALRGTCERLLQNGWGGGGRWQSLTLADLPGFDAAIACNATGIWPIAQVDDVVFAQSAALCARAAEVLGQVPWQPLDPCDRPG